MSLFSFDEITTEKKTDAALVDKYESVHAKKIGNIKDLIGEDFKENHIWFLWTQNSFNAFTFILYAVKHIGVIDELILTTYSINEKVINLLCKWHDRGMIRSITLFISDTMKVRNVKIHDLLQMQAEKRNITVIYAWNPAR